MESYRKICVCFQLTRVKQKLFSETQVEEVFIRFIAARFWGSCAILVDMKENLITLFSVLTSLATSENSGFIFLQCGHPK